MNFNRRHSDHGDAERIRHTYFEDLLIMKINELLTVNQSIKGQLNKAEAEIVGKITDLQTKIDDLVATAANADLPDDVVQSITDLQETSQSLDDIVADPTPTPTPSV